MCKKVLCSLLLIVGILQGAAGYVIKGHFNHLSSSYYPKLYISAIKTIDDLYKISNADLVNSVRIPPDGGFQLSGSDLPQQTMFYRLSLSKDEQSLMINGDPNFMIVALNPTSHIELSADSLRSFTDVRISANRLNIQIRDFYTFYRDLARRSINKPYISATQTDLARRYFKDQLLIYADNSTEAMVSLLAFIHLNNNNNNNNNNNIYLTDRGFVNRLIEKLALQYDGSPYLQDIKDELAVVKMENNEFVMNGRTKLLTCCLFVFIIAGFLAALRLIKADNQIQVASGDGAEEIKARLGSLTHKEQEITLLLVESLSNKEISAKLYIELSTVKTHINNIYNKLGISTRNDLLTILARNRKEDLT